MDCEIGINSIVHLQDLGNFNACVPKEDVSEFIGFRISGFRCVVNFNHMKKTWSSFFTGIALFAQISLLVIWH